MSEKWYCFTFADGYQMFARDMSSQEIKAEERKHGKLVSKVQG